MELGDSLAALTMIFSISSNFYFYDTTSVVIVVVVDIDTMTSKKYDGRKTTEIKGYMHWAVRSQGVSASRENAAHDEGETGGKTGPRSTASNGMNHTPSPLTSLTSLIASYCYCSPTSITRQDTSLHGTTLHDTPRPDDQSFTRSMVNS